MVESDNFKEIAERLQLVANDKGMWICGGKTSGENSVYLPEHYQPTRLIIEDCHK